MVAPSWQAQQAATQPFNVYNVAPNALTCHFAIKAPQVQDKRAKDGRRMANHTARLRRHMEIAAAMMIDETLAIVGELAPSLACTIARAPVLV